MLPYFYQLLHSILITSETAQSCMPASIERMDRSCTWREVRAGDWSQQILLVNWKNKQKNVQQLKQQRWPQNKQM